MNYEEYVKGIKKNSNATMFARDSYSSKLISNDDLMGGYKPYQSSNAFNPDLDTTEGLYKLAASTGLKNDADRVIQRVGGEKSEYMSGGIIMDFMDVLNTLSYGTVGLVKGKGFIEGVKSRESFSDEDSLGKYGWTGKIAGMALDIALDPLTYVAPWKLVTKIPGVVKGLDSAKAAAFGELETIKIGGQELFQRNGGWSPLNFFADKLVYGYGMDKKFLDGYQKMLGQADNNVAEAEKLVGMFSKIDPKVTTKTLTYDDKGFVVSKNIQELQRELPVEDFEKVKELYSMRDKLQQELIDVGYLSKDSADIHWNNYLKQEYDEFMLNKNQAPGVRKSGLGLEYKQRNYSLSKEERMALAPVDDAAVVWGSTLVKQAQLLRNAKLQKFVADNFSLKVDDVDEFIKKGGDVTQLHKVPNTPNYRIRGEEFDIKKSIGQVNSALKPALKQIRDAYKDNASVLSELTKMEARLKELPNLTEDALREGISDIKTFVKFVDSKTTYERKIVSQGQASLAKVIQEFQDDAIKAKKLVGQNGWSEEEFFNQFMKSRAGIALDRAFEDPAMMYNFDSPREFFEHVRYGKNQKHIVGGFRKTSDTEKIKKLQDKRLEDAERFQREYGQLKEVAPNIRNFDLPQVQNALIKAEAELSDLRFQKEDLLTSLNENRMGQLAGKYIPKPMWDMLKETMTPDKEVGEALVLGFKKMKVIWNPSAYPRNAVSAMIQNWWKLGLGPWRVDAYIDASKELKKGGKILNEMKELGFSEQSGVLNELRENYIQDKLMGKAISAQMKAGTNTKKVLKHIDRQLTNTYGHIDNVAKVAAYKFARKQGLSPKDSLKQAYAATYNYSQVTPFIHQMRRAIWGVPFITFSLKSVPLVASTIANNPGRISVFGKARNTLFEAAGVQGEQEQEVMPAWMRDETFMLRLPWKDGEGRSMYFDLTYIIPFGDIVTGGYMKHPLDTNPVLQTVKELSQNKTFSGYKIFNESDDIDTVIADVFMHTARKMFPPLVDQQLPKGYDNDGVRQFGSFTGMANGQDMGAGDRSFYQEMSRILGANVTPFDLDSKERKFDYERRQALQQLLSQNGILDEFTKPYIPEDSPIKEVPNMYDRNVTPLGR